MLAIMVVLTVLMQYRLWFGDSSIIEVRHKQQAVSAQHLQNEALKERNAALDAEVRDLKQGVAAIEERARSELGMIKDGEVFYLTADQK